MTDDFTDITEAGIQSYIEDYPIKEALKDIEQVRQE